MADTAAWTRLTDRAREQRLWLLAGTSLLVHAMALSLTPLWPEAEIPAPPPPAMPVELVEPPRRPEPPPPQAGTRLTPQPAPRAAPPAIPQGEAVAEPVPPRPAQDEDEEEEAVGEAVAAESDASSSEAPAQRVDEEGVGYPIPLASPPEGFGSLEALSRVQRSLDCFQADAEDPETYRLCGGVKPSDLVPEELRGLEFEDPAEFAAAVQARRAQMEGRAATISENHRGGVACRGDEGIASPGC